MAMPSSSTHLSGTETADRSEYEDDALPEFVFPLFLTSKTQEIFGCKVDEDVTSDSTFKLIPKEDILQDYKNRAAISDFHPAKSIIQNYPEEEVLLVYDPLFKYGQNFFLVTTEEGKEYLLNPPMPEPEEDDGIISETPSIVIKPPKPWVSLGSEQEIQNESVIDFRNKASFSILRKRKDFGCLLAFSDRNSMDVKDGSVDCPGYEDESYDLDRVELDKAVQNVPSHQTGCSQTNWPRPRNANVQYEPRVLPDTELENLQKSDELAIFFKNVLERVELGLQHNETIDIFTDDYFVLTDKDSAFGSKSDNHLKEYQSFTDLKFSKNKAVTKIQWHPKIRGLIAVSCAEQMSFDERIDNYSKVLMNPSFVLIWSFADPIHPLLLLEAPDDILCFQFNPSNPNIIAGGCINGQVVLWEISNYADRLNNHRSQAQVQSKHSRATLPSFLNLNKQELSPIVRHCAVSNIEHSHKMAVTDLQWIPDHFEVGRMGIAIENKPMHCNQLISAASDGQILFWDIRPNKSPLSSQPQLGSTEISQFKYLDLTWKPFLKVQARHMKGSVDMSAVKFSIAERFGEKEVKTKLHDNSEEQLQNIDRTSSSGIGFGRKKDEGKVLDHINTKFYVATEDGELLYMDWKLSKDIDTGKVISPRPEVIFEAHDGPMNTLERSPFFKDIILTVGGWTFAIWKENNIKGPLLLSSSHPVKLTSGFWSPSRPGDLMLNCSSSLSSLSFLMVVIPYLLVNISLTGVFFIGKSDGGVDVWDILDKTHEPFLHQNVTPVPVQTIFPYQVSSKQQLLAIGDKIGTLHIFEVPWNLRQPSINEITSVENYFQREARRLVYLEERANEKETLADISKKDTKLEDDAEWESKSIMAYQEYLELEKKVLEELGVKLSSDG